ncbi:hypothetical protein V565_348230 [Rhizoctonia solani 123E]|uniref:Uncharacterized protein n=1 Tax=Rhizoctonia solani 123E TaxID=1423351 RepID=A0A074RHN6_9AGAM|nr:hypothetical protein V565_348230 [Rhizoctonia solani 123E]
MAGERSAKAVPCAQTSATLGSMGQAQLEETTHELSDHELSSAASAGHPLMTAPTLEQSRKSGDVEPRRHQPCLACLTPHPHHHLVDQSSVNPVKNAAATWNTIPPAHLAHPVLRHLSRQ